MAQERAELLIALRDELSQKLTKIDQRVGGLTKTVAAGAKNRQDYAAGLKKIGGQALAATGMTIGLTGAVMGLRKAWAQAGEGLKANRIEAAFTQAAGGADAAGAALERMRGASAGALDDTSLQSFTNRAVRMGFAVEDAYTIMTLARQEALKTGESELALGQQLLQATATGRAQSLQAVGILMDNVAIERQRAVELKKTRAELTELEKIQARRVATLRRIKDLGAISPQDISQIEQAGTAWDNFISTMQQGWERALDPVAAARRAGAAMVAEFDPMTADAVTKIQEVTAQIREAQDELERATASAADPMAKAGGVDMFEAHLADVRSASRDLAMVNMALSTQAMRVLGTSNTMALQAADSLTTAREVLEKGLTPEQLAANREVLASYVDQFERLREVSQAFEGDTGDTLGRILTEQLATLQEEINALREREGVLEQSRTASLEWYREQAAELELLKGRGATLTGTELERLKILQQTTKAYQGHHAQLLKVVGKVQDLRGISKDLIPDLDVGSAARLDEAHRRLQEAQGAITTALKSGDLDTARRSLISYRASADAVALALRQAGVDSDVLNAYLRATGTQADYARERIDAYQVSISAKVFDDLLAGAGEMIKRIGSDETVQTVLARVEDTYQSLLLMGVKARKTAIAELQRIAVEARDSGTGAPTPEAVPTGVMPWEEEELRILEENLQGRDLIVAEHEIEYQRILAEFEGKRIDVDKANLELAKNTARERSAIVELEGREFEDAMAHERELQLERLNRERITGELTEFEHRRRVMDLDARLGYMDAELAAERRLTISIEEELAKRAELYRRLEAGVSEATEGISSALSGYQSLTSNMADDDRLDQRFIQRAQLLQEAGASSLRAIITATKGTTGETGAAMSSMVSNLGMAMAAFDKDAKRASLKMAMFSMASAMIAGVTKNYEKMAGFLAAAGMYTAIAGGAGAQRHRTQRADRPAIATSAGAAQGGGTGGINLTVIYQGGMAVATREELGMEILDAANAAAYTLTKLNPAVMGAG